MGGTSISKPACPCEPRSPPVSPYFQRASKTASFLWTLIYDTAKQSHPHPSRRFYGPAHARVPYVMVRVIHLLFRMVRAGPADARHPPGISSHQSADRQSDCCFGSDPVSYTHLTLPTSYSV